MKRLTDKIEELKKLRESLDKLWDDTNNDEGPKQELIVVFMDSIKNLLEEKDIKQYQVDIINESMRTLYEDENLTDDVVDYYIKRLIDNDIPVVRLPAGLSEMYET